MFFAKVKHILSVTVVENTQAIILLFMLSSLTDN